MRPRPGPLPLFLATLVTVTSTFAAHDAATASGRPDAAAVRGDKCLMSPSQQSSLRRLRLRRWQDTLAARARTAEREVSMDRHLLVQMQQIYSPRISASYYANLAQVHAELERALRVREMVRYLSAVVDRELAREEGFGEGIGDGDAFVGDEGPGR